MIRWIPESVWGPAGAERLVGARSLAATREATVHPAGTAAACPSAFAVSVAAADFPAKPVVTCPAIPAAQRPAATDPAAFSACFPVDPALRGALEFAAAARSSAAVSAATVVKRPEHCPPGQAVAVDAVSDPGPCRFGPAADCIAVPPTAARPAVIEQCRVQCS